MNIRRMLVSVAAVLVLGQTLGAQTGTPPATADTGSAAKDLLAKQMQGGTDVRESIRKSGLSPEQIRGRLKAAGMTESILDDYMGGAAGGNGAPKLPPTQDVLAAVAVLGSADAIAKNASTVLPVGTPTLPGETATSSPIPNLPTKENGLPVFGLDIFRRGSSQFEPNAVGPVDVNYRLGPLDVVAVILTGQVEQSFSPEVTRDGFIVIPQVGQIFVANLTIGQATQVIVAKLRQSFAGAGTSPNSTTKVYVTVARLRTNQLYVLGEVGAPGSYQVSASGTALTALYAAGGPTIAGRVREIEIRRGGKTLSTVDLYDYLLHGNSAGDVRLESGDQVFVPANPKHVTINGEVVRPAVYELKPGETLDKLLYYAGGLKTTASRGRIQISRILPPSERQSGARDRTVIDVIGDPEAPNSAAAFTPLQPGDVVTLYSVSTRVRNKLEVAGSVWTPGSFALRPGLRLSDALALAGGLRPDTYLDEIQVTRTLPNELPERVRIGLDSLGRPLNDLELREDDVIRVFSNTEFRTTRDVSIGGALRRSVNIPWARGVTMRDLILLGGEFEADTNVMNEVSLSRLLPDLTRQSMVVPLRDSAGRWNPFPLQPGDNLRIYSKNEFRTLRSVSLAGPLRHAVDVPWQRGITLRDLVLQGGGFEADTNVMNEVQVSRLLPDLTRETFDVPLRDGNGGWNPYPLESGDALRIFSKLEFRSPVKTVGVSGGVRHAVDVPWQRGITLRDLVRLGGGFEADTLIMNEVQLSRLLPDLTRKTLTVPLRDSTGAWSAIPLEPGDALRIYTTVEFRTLRNVSLSGGVRRPVEQPWQAGISLRDLVLQGGGFESSIDVLDTVTVSRIQPDLTRRSFTLPLRNAAGDINNTPLQAGDQLRMYNRSQFRPARTIRVGGAVRSGTELPFTEGMTLRQALLAAGGLEESALLSGVQISRLPERMQEGKLAEIVTVSLDSSYVFERGADGKYLGPQGIPAGRAPKGEFYLKPFDQINVLKQPEWDFGGSVTLTGEVRFPGSYALLRRNETIKDLVARAGGLTEHAYPEGAVFTRPVLPADASARKRLLEQVRRDRAYGMTVERINDRAPTSSAANALTPTAAVDAENRALNDVLTLQDSAAERIAIDLPNALSIFRSRDNLTVRPGDVLNIPLMNPTVTVRGFVGAPSTLPYRRGLSLQDYVNLAGGSTVNGDLGRAIVQQPNGQVEQVASHRFGPDGYPIPLAGSLVVVPPREPNRSDFSLTQFLTTLASLTTASVAIISIIRR